MKRKPLLPILAVVGVLLTVVVIFLNNRPLPSQPPTYTPARSPFASAIAGVGIVEAASGNIAIGTPVSGVIAKIHVSPGDHVDAGDPLFQIDDRLLRAQLATAQAQIKVMRTTLTRAKHRLDYLQGLAKRDPAATSEQELTQLRDEVAQAQAELELARAEARQITTRIELHTVRAPVAGQILQRRMRLGEFFVAGTIPTPMILLGDDSRWFVRVNVDEAESWRFQPGSRAVALLRGNASVSIALKFEYLEPYVVPKPAFTGRGTERTDTRVLQVLYSFERADQPVYAGQQLDVFIESNTNPENPGR